MRKNKSVYTSKYVVLHGSDITSVCHDAKGNWYFVGTECLGTLDGVMISWAELLDLDPSLKETESLPSGALMVRKCRNSDWRMIE